MDSVDVSIDLNNNVFTIKDNANAIIENYRAKYFFVDFLKARFSDARTIIIPYTVDEQEQTLKKIHDSLQKYGIEHSDSDTIKEVLNVYFREKENFKEFAKKAKLIWNNEIEPSDLVDFKSIIERTLVNPSHTLYDRQLLAAYHLAFSQNACNFSVPGAGKTTVVYAAYSYLKNLPIDNAKYVNKLLVIGPLSSFGPWEDEFYECFGQRVFSVRLSGGMPKDERDKYLRSLEPANETPELILMSYQSVPYNLGGLLYYLQKRNHHVMVVLDEAHRIKNVDGGIWASSVLSFSKYCRSRVVLTGTPIPNGYEDLFNLFDFIWPGKNLIEFSIPQLRDMTEKRFDPRIKKLVDNVSPFFIRIRKSHLNLPPIVNNDPTFIEMGNLQREIYRFIEDKYFGFFINSTSVASFSAKVAKARFIRLMQVATNPSLLKRPLDEYFLEQGLSDDLNIDDSEIINKILHYHELEGVPKKFIEVKRIVEDLISKNEKVIVWGTFIQNIKELQEYLLKNGIASELLIGEIPVERDDIQMNDVITREKIIREFHKKDSAFKVIIANPFAVSESISLHRVCHNAIYLERTFNATHFIQSKDRIHRVGLDPETVTYYHYILSKNSIDETIHHRLAEKEKRMLEIIENQEIPLFSENMDYDIDLEDDIKALIRDYVRRTTKV